MTWDPVLSERPSRERAWQGREHRARRGTGFSSESPVEVVERLPDPTEDLHPDHRARTQSLCF